MHSSPARRIDRSGFYTGYAQKAHRSISNVTFNLSSVELLRMFLTEALREDLYALKGHRELGGVRASLYNAMPIEGVRALVAFMDVFEQRYG